MDKSIVEKLKKLVEEYENYKDDICSDYSQIAEGAIEEIVNIIKNL